MHELLLFGQVPASRHTQVLNVLAGIAAMQPQPVLEKHLVFKPNRKPALGRQMQVGGAQDVQAKAQALQAQTQGDLYYLQLVAEVDERRSKEEDREQVDTIMTDNEPAVGEVSDKGLPYGFPVRKLTNTIAERRFYRKDIKDNDYR